jgi:ubiquinone/menaquinone biosynthesis C-methylase UbiE
MNDEMDWDAYAKHYDEMCDLNPAYRQNIELLLDRLSTWSLPDNPSICDVGAGTGNYIAALSNALPSASFTHVDFDARMIETAKAKYARLGVEGVSCVQARAQEIEFPAASFDLIISINALYAISPQRDLLVKMKNWLRPGGKLFLIDFGRQQNTTDWALYVLRECAKAGKLTRYFRALIEAREVLKQNRQTTKGQGSGRYWLHTTQEFNDVLIDCGFAVREVFSCYRGYCDCAICDIG